MRRLALLPLLLLAACDALPVARTATYDPGVPASVDQAMCRLGFTAVPMTELPSGHHLVEATLNGKAARFVVDTGANATVLHAPLVADYGLDRALGVAAGAVGLGGQAKAGVWRYRSLRLGEVEVSAGRIISTDLSQMVNFLGARADQPIVGILGQDVLSAQQAVIDVPRPILYLRPRGAKPAAGPADCGPRRPA